jgi:hypothetical protein
LLRRPAGPLPSVAGGVGAGGLALAEQVVAVLADGGGLAAGLGESAAGLAAAAGGAARAGQQQAQPEQAECPDHDAVQEQRAGGAGHVVAEHREGWVSACALPLFDRTPATPATTAAIRMTSPMMMIMTYSGDLSY